MMSSGVEPALAVMVVLGFLCMATAILARQPAAALGGALLLLFALLSHDINVLKAQRDVLEKAAQGGRDE